MPGRGLMEGLGVPPEDAADAGHADEAAAGRLRQDISAAVVGLYKTYLGTGPTRCRTYLHPDLAIVVLGGGYSMGEQTMLEAGKWYEVREARLIWQDSMQARFTAAIEELTQRRVSAFMSANRQDPDLSVELFVLEPEPTAEAPHRE
jgi:uncharacterized protein YbcI